VRLAWLLPQRGEHVVRRPGGVVEEADDSTVAADDGKPFAVDDLHRSGGLFEDAEPGRKVENGLRIAGEQVPARRVGAERRGVGGRS
jgi:hypothetical protein